MFKNFAALFLLATLAACHNTQKLEDDSEDYFEISHKDFTAQEASLDVNTSDLCNGSLISTDVANRIILLTKTADSETIYTIYNRIDEIAMLFESCGDPWGMFPTAYRHITNRIIEAIENEEIEDQEWARSIVLDFASRYFANLELALLGEQPSYAWAQYYYLADHQDASRVRAVVVAMVAHLTLDLPNSLVAIDTTEGHKDDYFALGELMIEITPDFIEDLRYYYNTDAEDILNGFFFGDWVDGAFGSNTTITLSYQTIRTKSWNNRGLIESGWAWIADAEIYTAFWTIDGVLAALDAAGTI
tara:strand:+ start:590 stop:1498 length:909 start_codon:yes stop_codon:yes gene_type:complete